MAVYRSFRNFLGSIVYYLDNELTSDWNDVSIVKGFNIAYDTRLPVVSVRLENTTFKPVQIGDNSVRRYITLFIDIFGDSDGLSEDLTDYIVDLLRDGCIFYEIETQVVSRVSSIKQKTANGRISFKNITARPINFDTDRAQLDAHDKHRWLINATITTGNIEE